MIPSSACPPWQPDKPARPAGERNDHHALTPRTTRSVDPSNMDRCLGGGQSAHARLVRIDHSDTATADEPRRHVGNAIAPVQVSGDRITAEGRGGHPRLRARGSSPPSASRRSPAPADTSSNTTRVLIVSREPRHSEEGRKVPPRRTHGNHHEFDQERGGTPMTIPMTDQAFEYLLARAGLTLTDAEKADLRTVVEGIAAMAERVQSRAAHGRAGADLRLCRGGFVMRSDPDDCRSGPPDRREGIVAGRTDQGLPRAGQGAR